MVDDGDNTVKRIINITGSTGKQEDIRRMEDVLRQVMEKKSGGDCRIIGTSNSSRVVTSKFTDTEISIKLELKGTPAKDGKAIDISVFAVMSDNNANAIKDEGISTRAIENTGRLAAILRERLAAVVAGCESNEIFENREAFAGIARELLAKELAKDGIELVSFAIADIKQAG